MNKEAMLEAVKGSIEECKFIPFSSLPLSEKGKESISDSGNITFGDANRTMISLSRFADVLSDTNYPDDDEGEDERVENDAAIILALIETYGENFYIDLEN